MAFRDYQAHEQSVQLLQRSLRRGRLAHGYLFSGSRIEELEQLAMELAKTLNCANPVRAENGAAIDCCDACGCCTRIQSCNHGDVHWVRPESKLRVVTIAQVRELNSSINLKSGEAQYKLGIVVGADRLNAEAANAFLKTLEEPPPRSVFVLLTTDSSRVLETILSRCLRLTFGGEGQFRPDNAQSQWVARFAQAAAVQRKSLLGRYLVLDQLLAQLGKLRKEIETQLEERSPLSRHPDAEKDLRDKWESELNAAVEAEYRRSRAGLLLALQYWLRDVWMCTLQKSPEAPGEQQGMLSYPALAETGQVAARLTPEQARTNLELIETLQTTLHTNVQEALALEVGLLKLRL